MCSEGMVVPGDVALLWQRALRSEDTNVQGVRGLINYTEENREGQGGMHAEE